MSTREYPPVWAFDEETAPVGSRWVINEADGHYYDVDLLSPAYESDAEWEVVEIVTPPGQTYGWSRRLRSCATGELWLGREGCAAQGAFGYRGSCFQQPPAPPATIGPRSRLGALAQ